MEKIIIFILFLGPLVFFHELGHFIFARIFGVRVEVFSLGFGPKLFKFIRKDTEYALSLIPLGGYVKMFGDDPLSKDAIPVEDRKFSFNHKGKWARFWIVIGGTLANFLLAYFVFFSLLLSGETIPEIRTGVIPEASILYQKGLRPGDVLETVNGNEIYNPTDLVLKGSDTLDFISIRRNNESIEIPIGMDGLKFFKEFIKYPPYLRAPYLSNSKGEKLILSVSKKEPSLISSIDFMAALGDGHFYIFKEENNNAQNKYKLVDNFFLKTNSSAEFFKQLAVRGYRSWDLVVKSVKMGAPADKAGIKKGDIFISLQGESIFSFQSLKDSLQLTKTELVELGFWRNGKKIQIKMKPYLQELDGEKLKLIGVYSSGEIVPLNFIKMEGKGFFVSLTGGFIRSWDTLVKTFDGLTKLLKGDVPFKSLGGPLSIGKVASDSFNISLSYFFQLMALISINLAVINLFPIPVLDGGHIMFILLEIVNRGPVSRKKMEIAQQVGLSLLLMLMIGAIFNDVTRFF